jgi:hypothetical protein
MHRGLLYMYSGSSDETELQLEGFTDAGYAADPDKRRSTGGYVFMLVNGAISWASKLLPTVAVSTMEARYMAAAWAAKEALWLRKLLTTLLGNAQAVQMCCDNQGALRLMHNPCNHQRAKHIEVVHHFLRERVARGEIKVDFCRSEDMVADVLTKAVPKAKHELCCELMGLIDVE